MITCVGGVTGCPVGKGSPHPASHEVSWNEVDGLEMEDLVRRLEKGCGMKCLGLVLALAWVLA